MASDPNRAAESLPELSAEFRNMRDDIVASVTSAMDRSRVINEMEARLDSIEQNMTAAQQVLAETTRQVANDLRFGVGDAGAVTQTVGAAGREAEDERLEQVMREHFLASMEEDEEADREELVRLVPATRRMTAPRVRRTTTKCDCCKIRWQME